MRKAIKRTISILICLIYTAMLLPAAHAAGESLSDVAEKFTFELFTQNEPDYALTKNIYFDPTLLPLPDGYTVSFSSSDSSVIEVVDVAATESYGAYQYGRVIRDKYSDKSAVITMALSDGTDTITKEFPFTVASEATKIYYSDTFRYPGYAGKFVQEVPGLKSTTPVRQNPSLTYGVGWQSLYATEFDDTSVNGRRFRTLLDNTDNNYSLRAERPFAAEEYNYTRYVFGDKPDDKTEISMRLMMDETERPQIYIFHLWGTFITENGATIRKQVLEMQLHRRNDGHYLSATNATGELSKSYTKVRPENGEWFKLTMTFDVKNQTYDLYYNDEKLNDTSHNFYMKYDETLEIVNLNDLQFNAYRKNSGGAFYVDDMVVRTDSYFLEKNKHLYELRDEIILDSVMEEADGEFNAQGIDSDITANYSNTNAQTLMETNNLSVEWTSDNEDVLSVNDNNFTAVQPDLDTKVNLTAKIIDNATGDYIEETFEVKVICDEATREINDAYNALTAERLTTQVLSAVTEDLALPEFEDVNIQWISNSPYLTTDGKVTRGDEDRNVILSAVISNAGTDFTARKSFDITILAESKKVYSADNLYYPGKEGLELSSAKLDLWANEYTVQAERYTNTVMIDEDYNYVMSSERVNANSKDYNFTRYAFDKPLGKEGEVSFRFKLLHTQKPQLYIFQLWGYTRDSNKALASKQAVEIKIEYTGSGGYVKTASPEVYIRNGELETDRWYTMKIAFDNGKKVFDVYLDGEKLNDAPLVYFDNSTESNVEQIDFINMHMFRYNSFRDKAGAKFYVDDVAAVGKGSIEMQTVLYDDGIYRTTDTTGVITGVADGKLYIYNPANTTVKGTAVLAAYDNDKLIWAKTEDVSLTSNNRATILYYNDLDIPFSGNTEIKSFFFAENSISPKTEEAVINNDLRNMKPITMYDSNTGNSYKVLNMFGNDIIKCYFTMQPTSADGSKLYFHDADFNLYEYDMVKEEGRFLDRLLNDYTIVTSPLGNVFYINKDHEIIKMNCDTHEKTLVTKIPEDYSTGKVSMIQVNNDESLISVEWADLKIEEWEDGEKHESRFPVYNLVTGEWLLDVTYGFDTPWYAPNHKSINPNPEMGHLELFAHEGQHVKDRVWVMNLETGVPYNVYVQKPYSNAESGENAGHEGWTYDGQHVFFIGGASGRIGGYSGLTWVDYDGKNRRYITTGSFCHAGIHPYTDRWAVADTSYNGTDTTITLIDCYTGDTYPVATVHQTGVDPGHCHPNISFDGKTAIFGMYDPNDTISIGWADLSKYIDAAPDVHYYDLSDNCTIETAERSEKGEPAKVIRDGVTAYHIPADGIMRVQYRGEEIESTGAEITVEYLDAGTENIILEYMTWQTGETNTLVRHTAELPIAGSGEWVEKKIILNDINLENMELREGDFLIKGGTEGATISNVSVTLREPISAEEAIGMLNFEEIFPQPMTMITEDLNLPGKAGDSGVAISWTTSDETVITSGGKVTRDSSEVKNVTLTATATDMEGSASVKYDLTVLPETYNVYKTQNFYYPDDDMSSPTLSGSFINAPMGRTLSVDTDGNYYASFDFGENGLANGNSASATLFDTTNRHQTVYLYTKIKTSGEAKNGIDVRTTIRDASTNADQGKSITVARIKGNNVYTNAASKLAGTLSSSDFTPVIFKIDLLTSAGAIKVGNGEWVEINSFESSYTYPTDGTKHMLGALNFVRAGSSTPEGVLHISEAAAYTID